MVRRIESGVTSQLNPFGPQWPTAKAEKAATAGQQVQIALFGKPKPPVLDPARFPQLAAQLRLLNRYRRKLATLAGDDENDYRLALADGTIAMIDEAGTIYVGAGFLESFADQPEVLVGALAHEIGHRPKRWNGYRGRGPLSPEALAELCRHEETRADLFAGAALAEMEMSCEPICQFLIAVEEGPHPEYFPATVRADVIRDAYRRRSFRTETRAKLFPDYHRAAAAKGHLGEY